jgi:hypothetical protein
MREVLLIVVAENAPERRDREPDGSVCGGSGVMSRRQRRIEGSGQEVQMLRILPGLRIETRASQSDPWSKKNAQAPVARGLLITSRMLQACTDARTQVAIGAWHLNARGESDNVAVFEGA